MAYRVLHVIDSLDLGGAQVVLLNLLQHADRERFQLEAVTLHGHGVFWDRLRAAGVPVERREFPRVTHEFFGGDLMIPEARAAQGYAGQRLRIAFGAR